MYNLSCTTASVKKLEARVCLLFAAVSVCGCVLWVYVRVWVWLTRLSRSNNSGTLLWVCISLRVFAVVLDMPIQLFAVSADSLWMSADTLF